MNEESRYYSLLAAAYVRGKLADEHTDHGLFTRPIHSLSEDELGRIAATGTEKGLKLHRFKRNADLPRVRRVLGMLKAIWPRNLLDIGSGRGVFLWPLADTFPDLPVHATDILDHRLKDINAVRCGGAGNVSSSRMSVTDLACRDRAFDAVTLLEVLEHLGDPERAVREACRVAGRALIISVPSKEDGNPGHIHLFDENRIRVMLEDAGAFHLKIDYVPNHMIVLANMEK